MTAIHSYTVQLCDVPALRSTCTIMLRFLALYPSHLYCKATTWRLAQQAHGQGRPLIVFTAICSFIIQSSFITTVFIRYIYMPFLCYIIKYKTDRRRDSGRPDSGFPSTWHCEYVAGALSYHTAPWYFITSHDVMFKLNSTWRDTGAERFKASKSHLSAGLSSAAAH